MLPMFVIREGLEASLIVGLPRRNGRLRQWSLWIGGRVWPVHDRRRLRCRAEPAGEATEGLHRLSVWSPSRS
jgi:hypothetical protein